MASTMLNHRSQVMGSPNIMTAMSTISSGIANEMMAAFDAVECEIP